MGELADGGPGRRGNLLRQGKRLNGEGPAGVGNNPSLCYLVKPGDPSEIAGQRGQGLLYRHGTVGLEDFARVDSLDACCQVGTELIELIPQFVESALRAGPLLIRYGANQNFGITGRNSGSTRMTETAFSEVSETTPLGDETWALSFPKIS